MKRNLSILAILLMALSIPQTAKAAYSFSAITSSGHTLYYDYISGTNVYVTYPGSGSNYTGPYYGYTKPVGNLVIDSTVTYNRTTYRVTSIGYIAFSDCTGLTSVTIPNSVTSFGDRAFCNCTGLTSLVFNATNCTSAYSAFSGCPITSVTFGNSVQNIPAYLLYGCTGLTSVTIPNSVTSIGNYAFNGCTGLTSVSIPNSVTTIGERTFRDCTGLTSVSIPNSVTSIGDYVFEGCSINSPVYNNHCFAFMPKSQTGSYFIQDGITYICGGAFDGCTGLTSVTIPNSVTSIGNYAFDGCTGLTSVTIPNSVTSIGNDAFNGCLRLTSVSLGEGVIDIGSQAFKDCGIIGELVIPQSVTTIGSEGFRNCYGVNEITCLGRVATSLDDDVFLGLDTSITVNIPCGTTNLYAGRWSYFHNFNEIPFLFKVATDNPAQGTVQMLQEPSCDDPVAVVRATARSGYHFDHWSDGSTQNPYTCVVTGSMTLTAFFASDSGPIGIEDADGETSAARVYTNGTQIIVEGADSLPVYLYDAAGRLLSTQPSGQSPCHLTAPSAGNYLVKIGDLPARKIVIVR